MSKDIQTSKTPFPLSDRTRRSVTSKSTRKRAESVRQRRRLPRRQRHQRRYQVPPHRVGEEVADAVEVRGELVARPSRPQPPSRARCWSTPCLTRLNQWNFLEITVRQITTSCRQPPICNNNSNNNNSSSINSRCSNSICNRCTCNNNNSTSFIINSTNLYTPT